MSQLEIPLDARIYVAGHRGLVGSAVMRRLARDGFSNLLVASRDELDLRDQAAVDRMDLTSLKNDIIDAFAGDI